MKISKNFSYLPIANCLLPIAYCQLSFALWWKPLIFAAHLFLTKTAGSK